MEIPSYMDSTVAFLRKENIASHVWSFYFTKPSSFHFLPGQYMDITLEVPSHRQEVYSFTISSAPSEDTLRITTRDSNTEFKKSLFGLTKGQKIKIRGPLGMFVVDQTNLLPKVFLAGGIGITPFRSMLMDTYSQALPTQTILLASFSTKEDILFEKEMELLENEKLYFKRVYTLTQNQDDSWKGHAGRISKQLIEEVVSSFAYVEYFIAGSGGMVDDMVSLLRSMGVESNTIKTDIFTGL